MVERSVFLESRVLTVMRTTRGWKKNRLAVALGLQPGTLYEYENGDLKPSRQLLERAAALMGFGPAFVDRTFAYLRQADADRQLGSSGGADAASDREIDRISIGVSLELEGLLRAGLQRTRRRVRAFEERQAAKVLWARLAPHTAKERQAIVLEGKRYQTWALSELLCDESLAAAPDSADRAVELADLAVLAARLSRGTEAERVRIHAYALTHLGNAHRVHGDLPSSDTAFAESAERWKAGGGHDPDGLLNEARMLGLEASLRHAQRLLPKTLDLLDQALAVDKGDLTQHLLINRARTLEECGDYEEAAATLRRALPLIDGEREPRLFLNVRFNFLVNLCDAGHPQQAERLLDEVQELTERLNNALDLVHLVWLRAKVHAGLGRPQEAEAAFEQVRQAFLSRGIAYNAALVSLELAVLLLEQGRPAEVRTIVNELVPVFKAQRVTREALAAFELFRNAVEQETITVELARRCLEDLRRAGGSMEGRPERTAP
jgi:tetratricopeptide (TPR) repeat protein